MKTPLERFTSSKLYKQMSDECQLETWWIGEFILLHTEFKYEPKSRNKRIVFWIENKFKNWLQMEIESRKYHNSTLNYHLTVYGEKMGVEIYNMLNTKKDTGLFRDSNFQKRNSIKANKIKKENGGKSDVRNCMYWMDKHGMDETEAKEQIKKIQKTNTLENYIKKYGNEVGVEKFNDRKTEWVKKMDKEEIKQKRSLSLNTYICKFGAKEGKKRYIEMRIKRNSNSRIGNASKESLKFLKPLLEKLDSNNIHYFIGVDGNKEFFIKHGDDMFFYDLTIPKLNIIIEYHGNAFHPDLRMGEKYLKEWKQAYTSKTWESVYFQDERKRVAAESVGWKYYSLFPTDSLLLHEIIDNLFYRQFL